MKFLGVTIQMKPIEHYVCMVLFVFVIIIAKINLRLHVVFKTRS